MTSSEERTRLILETANDAFVAINEDGVIVDWNRAAEVTFGYPADQAIGRRLVETIIPSRLRADHQRGLDRFLATGQQRVLFERAELPALHRDGHEFPVEATIWPTREADGSWRFNAFLRDVSERVRLEWQGRLVHQVTATANAATTAEEAVRSTCRAVLEFTGWDVAHAYLPSGPELLRPTGWWEPADGDWAVFREETAGCTFALGAGLPGRVAASKAPHWIVDLEGDDNFPRQAAAVACGLRSAHAFPVVVDDRVVAVLEFYSRTEQAPAPELVELMADVGVQLGRVFERHEAQEARSRMIAMIAHEVRSPLTAMTGYTELLEDAWDELSDDERRAIRR